MRAGAGTLNGPRYATLNYTEVFTNEISTSLTKGIEEVETSFSVAGLAGPPTAALPSGR